MYQTITPKTSLFIKTSYYIQVSRVLVDRILNVYSLINLPTNNSKTSLFTKTCYYTHQSSGLIDKILDVHSLPDLTSNQASLLQMRVAINTKQQIKYLVFTHHPIQHQIQPLHYECELLQTLTEEQQIKYLMLTHRPIHQLNHIIRFIYPNKRLQHHSQDGGAYPKH